MPVGEVETHPYLHIGEAVPNATRLILGSFPVYYCTGRDTPFKRQIRAEKGIAQFFYGSHRSKFWQLYQTHVDPLITLPIIASTAIASLCESRIAISDLIMSAERVNHSASDNDLLNQQWNTVGLASLFNQGVIKVLCTSKGVLNDLGNKIICANETAIGNYSDTQAKQLQSRFVERIGGNVAAIIEPIAGVYAMNNEHTISAICIPSPGSFQRSIQHFGYTDGGKSEYATRYFRHAFNWLLED